LCGISECKMSEYGTFEATSEEEMVAVGRAIARFVCDPIIICLEGELGAGKTTIAKGLISELTSLAPQEITSPTFQYVHLYETDRFEIAHFDLWRVRDLTEFLSLGLDEHIVNTLSLIEWPDRIGTWLPKDVLSIGIQSHDQGRTISLTQGS